MNLYSVRSDDPSVLSAIRSLMLLGAPLEVHLSDDKVTYPGMPSTQFQNHEVTFIQRGGGANMYTATAGFLGAYPMMAYTEMKDRGMIAGERQTIEGATVTAGSLSEAMGIVEQRPDPALSGGAPKADPYIPPATPAPAPEPTPAQPDIF